MLWDGDNIKNRFPPNHRRPRQSLNPRRILRPKGVAGPLRFVDPVKAGRRWKTVIRSGFHEIFHCFRRIPVV